MNSNAFTFAYIRVSTKEQNIDRQKVAIEEYAQANGIQVDRWFEDKRSGKNFDRPEWQALKGMLRHGDTLIIKELDRLGRNMDLIRQEWTALQEMGVSIIVVDTPELNTAKKTDLERKLISDIMFSFFSYFSQKELEKNHARQAEGIAIAKAQGKYLGRKPIVRDNFETVYTDWKSGNITAVEAARQLNLSKSTFYRKVKQYEELHNV